MEPAGYIVAFGIPKAMFFGGTLVELSTSSRLLLVNTILYDGNESIALVRTSGSPPGLTHKSSGNIDTVTNGLTKLM